MAKFTAKAKFTDPSGVVWTQNHAFAVGAEVNFIQTDTAEWITDIPFSVGGLQITSGNLNYNTNGKTGASVILIRIGLLGDVEGGDAGLGPGSLILINKSLYVFHGEDASADIHPFAVQLNNHRFPPPPNGGPYRFKIHADAAGPTWPAHCEIALAGMWWDVDETPPVGV